ncbi:MAG: hypothetical protein HY544_02190 [Candidatus Diapherotrites archaeon]|uniref:Uncharacterized protein n=1 Tax=Candidatus Iainarchaeum sp. TaxID=3101447 RepID=A0A8T3YJT6_9ARCH|nr:hypothetical protein [Candidatus Diapherotrites archaeon]
MRLGFFAIALALLASTASAFTVTGFEGTISIAEKPYDFTFTIKNETAVKQPLSIDFTAPTHFEFVEKPDYVNANSEAEITARIYPEKGFEGTTYAGRATLKLGGSTAEKSFAILYNREDSCTIERQVSASGGDITLMLENTSYRQKTISLTGVKGAPEGIRLAEKGEYSLGPFEKREFKARIEGNVAFKGDAELEFSCHGSTITSKVGMDYKAGGTDLAALLSLGGISGTRQGDAEMVFDALLAITASILLIAFIARLVRFLNSGKKE